MSRHSTPASASARRIATAPMSMRGHAREAAERVQPHPDDRDVVHHACRPAQATGRNANVTTSLPSSSVRNGTSTSSISMPVREHVGVGLGEARLDLHLAGELDVADAERHEVLAGRPRVRRRRRREVLRGPRPQPAPARRAGARPSRSTRSAGTSPARESDDAARGAAAADQLRVVGRPGEDAFGDRDLRHHASLRFVALRTRARSSSFTTLPVAFTGSASRNSTNAAP